MLDFYLIFNFFISTFIFYFLIIIFIDHAHWRFVYHVIIFIWTSYSIFSKNHTRDNWSEKNKNKNRNEMNEMKINLTLCFSNLSLNIQIQFINYIIKLLEKCKRLINHSINSNNINLWKCFWHDSTFRLFNKFWQ